MCIFAQYQNHCQAHRTLKIADCKQTVICYNVFTMATKQQNYQKRIVRVPGLVGGKPVVKGTRIPVAQVLQYLAYDPDVKTLFEAFTRLTLEDVKACLDYAEALVAKEEKAEEPK